MYLLYNFFKLDPKARSSVITLTASLGIVLNLSIAIMKVLIGTAVSSMAIISEGVNNATDMMLHNYGPDTYSGSVNIEINHKYNLGDIYKIIHKLQLRIMHEFKITMVFGIYAIDNDNPDAQSMRLRIAEFIRGYEHLIAYHALYIDAETKDIYIDLVVDYELKDWEKLRYEFTEYMKKYYPQQKLQLVIETQYI